MLINSVTVEQILQKEIEDSKRWIDRKKDESTYKRDLKKRLELINWVLDNIKKQDLRICELIETKMNEIIDEFNKTILFLKPIH